MSQFGDYGLLVNKDTKLHRQWFIEMTKLQGINVKYRATKSDKHWTTYAEIDSNYEDPITIGCIFEDHPSQRTMRKLGWVSELQESESVIHLPYDTPNLQVGCLVVVPSGIDCSEGRLFRITEISNIMVFPYSMSCKIVPEFESTYDKALSNHQDGSFNLLSEDGDGNL